MGRFRKADWAQKKRPKFRKRIKKSFEREEKTNLASSDKGSWFDQESLYAEEGSESELDELDEEDTNEESASESSANLFLISLSLLETQLNATSVCKECHSDLKIIDEKKKRQGLGASWEIYCTNNDCPSKSTKKSFPISPKDGRSFAVNKEFAFHFLQHDLQHPLLHFHIKRNFVTATFVNPSLLFY